MKVCTQTRQRRAPLTHSWVAMGTHLSQLQMKEWGDAARDSALFQPVMASRHLTSVKLQTSAHLLPLSPAFSELYFWLCTLSKKINSIFPLPPHHYLSPRNWCRPSSYDALPYQGCRQSRADTAHEFSVGKRHLSFCAHLWRRLSSLDRNITVHVVTACAQLSSQTRFFREGWFEGHCNRMSRHCGWK